jgi:hypothetical protein
MHLDQWLKQVYDEEALTKEGFGLEVLFDKMGMSDLLDIACGRTTIEKVAENKPAPIPAQELRSPQPEPVTQKTASVEKIGLASKAKLAFMDKVARQIARQHAEVAKEAACGGGMVKSDEFTSPEAQQKAKALQSAMKATKGAPLKVRKGAVRVTAKQLQKVGAESDKARRSRLLRTAAGLAAAGLGVGALGYAVHRGRKDASTLKRITDQFKKTHEGVQHTLRARGLKK